MDKLDIKRGHIIGLPQIVELLEEAKAVDIKDYIIAFLQSPGVCLSQKLDGTWGDDLKVEEVDAIHIKVHPGRAVSAIYSMGRVVDVNLIKVPDDIGTEYQNIEIPVFGWPVDELRYLYIEYVEEYDISKNLPLYDANWIDHGRIYKVKSFKFHYESAFLLSSPWILLCSIIPRTGPDRLEIEDLRGSNVFKLKPPFVEAEQPPQPKLWLKTGFEKDFRSTTVKDNINNFLPIRSAYVLIAWGDEGEGIVGTAPDNKHIVATGKSWEENIFAGQYITLIELHKRLKVISSEQITGNNSIVRFDEAVVPGSYHYIIGPHAEEYSIHASIVRDTPDPDPVTWPDALKAYPEFDKVCAASTPIPSESGEGYMGKHHYYIGSLEGGLKLKIQVIARNRRLMPRESISDPAYIITGWGDPPDPPALLRVVFDMNNIKIRLGHLNSEDIMGFEVYMQGESIFSTINPFLDSSGNVDESKLTENRLISNDKRFAFTFPVITPEAGSILYFVARAYDGAGQRSSCIWTSTVARIRKAPKPKGLIVVTGVIESDDREALKERSEFGLFPLTAYIYATWAEKSTSIKVDGNIIPVRTATVIGLNKVRIIQTGYGGVDPVIKWVEGNFNDYKVTLKDEANHVETRTIVSCKVTPEGYGELTLDADLRIITSGSQLFYIIHPGATSYVVVLEAVNPSPDINPTFVSPALYQLDGDKYQVPITPILRKQMIIDFPDPEIVPNGNGNGDEPVDLPVTTNEAYFEVSYGKKYRVKVAGMYGRDERTMSEFAVSGDIIAGIRVETGVPIQGKITSPARGFAYIDFTITINNPGEFLSFEYCWEQTRTQNPGAASFETCEIHSYPGGILKTRVPVTCAQWITIRVRGVTTFGDISRNADGSPSELVLCRQAQKCYDLENTTV